MTITFLYLRWSIKFGNRLKFSLNWRNSTLWTSWSYWSSFFWSFLFYRLICCSLLWNWNSFLDSLRSFLFHFDLKLRARNRLSCWWLNFRRWLFFGNISILLWRFFNLVIMSKVFSSWCCALLLSSSKRWLDSSILAMISYVFLKSYSIIVDIDFEFEFIVFREIRLEFMTTNIIIFESCN